MTSPSAGDFAALLTRLSPRAQQALRLRVLEGRPAPECAEFFGISLEAFALMLLRAARELEAARQGASSSAPEGDFERERAEAEALEKGLAESAPSVRADRLREMGAQGPQILAHLAAVEREHQQSPAFRRETLIRRSLVLVVLLLTAYFYFRANPGPVFQPRPPASAPRR